MSEVTEDELKGIKFIRCGICGQKFSKNHINRHLSIYHPEEYKKYKKFIEKIIEHGIDKL